MPFERIVRCPSCGKQIDVLTTPTRTESGMGEAMVLGDARRMHARQSPECIHNPKWCEGWHIDDFVEVAAPSFAKPAGDYPTNAQTAGEGKPT